MPDHIEPDPPENYPAVPSAPRLLLQELVKRRISVKALASAARIQPAVVYALLRNRVRFSAQSGVRIALALGVDHRRFLIAQACHDTYGIAQVLAEIEGPIRRAPVVCEPPPPAEPRRAHGWAHLEDTPW